MNCVRRICSRPTRGPRAGLDLIGIFHSHPDCDAYFSKTDLEEFLSVVFVRRTIDQERASSITRTASCRTPTRPPRRKKN